MAVPFKKGFDDRRAKGGKREGSGRPPDEIRELCRKLVNKYDLIGRLAKIANGEDMEQIVTSEGTTLRVPAPVSEQRKATEILLDRGYGKAIQSLEHNVGQGSRLVIVCDGEGAEGTD